MLILEIQLQRFWDRIDEMDLPQEAGGSNLICQEPWISTYNAFERCGQPKIAVLRKPTERKSSRSLKGGRFLSALINNVGNNVGQVLETVNNVGNLLRDAKWKPGMILDSIGNNLKGVIKEGGNQLNQLIRALAGQQSSDSSAGSQSLETYTEESDCVDSNSISSEVCGEAGSNEDASIPLASGMDSQYSTDEDDSEYEGSVAYENSAEDGTEGTEGSGEQPEASGVTTEAPESTTRSTTDNVRRGRFGHRSLNGRRFLNTDRASGVIRKAIGRSLKGRRFLNTERAPEIIKNIGDILKQGGWKPGMFIDSLGKNLRDIIKESGNLLKLRKDRRSSAEREDSETSKKSDETNQKSDGEDSYYQSSDYLPSREVRSNEQSRGGSRSNEASESLGATGEDDGEYEGSSVRESTDISYEEDNNEGSGEGEESGSGSGSNDDYEGPDEDASGDSPTSDSGRRDAADGDYGEDALASALDDYFGSYSTDGDDSESEYDDDVSYQEPAELEGNRVHQVDLLPHFYDN